jgi:DNA-binding response OmpR family regulator/tRNA A-37 threonylcarbamoyl transferase component Bud32
VARIVLVEDDVPLADTIKAFLEYESHLVKVFHNGVEAQNFILANEADLIILDWDMPGLSGIEILRDYRAFGGRCPVIMMTGHHAIRDQEQGFDDGADDYLTKPFHLKELTMRIMALLRRSQATIGNVITVGDIVVDLDTSKVLKSGRAVALLPREFQLLSYLIKNRREDPPKGDELLSLVWSTDAEMTPTAFSNVVRGLARKLDPDGQILRIAGIMKTIESSAVSDRSENPMIGRVLDNKYEIIKAIGGGASGTVYKGKHKMMNIIIAIKVLAPQLSTQSELVRRFEREARAAALLGHKNVLVVHDLGMTEELQPYMVMEYLNGVSLAEMLEQNGRLSVADSLDIVSQICQGIGKAHQEGLVHRDLKPGNIMLVAEGEHTFTVKIVDFGLAKLIRPEGNENLTQSGSLMGTPSYMSPEQCRSEPTDHRCDIYAIGCMLHEMLTGEKPFSATNVIEIYMKHAQDPPPLLILSNVNPEIANRLQQIVHRCLEKNKENRFQSAEELLHELSTLKEGVH